MYRNLIMILQNKGITNKQLAEFLGVSEKTAYNKLHLETDFTLPEALKISKYICPEYSFDFVFCVFIEDKAVS